MKLPLTPLRDHVINEVSRLSVKFPNLGPALGTLKDRTLARLANEELDFDGFQKALEAMVRDADELDTDGYMFAISQQLTNQLDGMLRSALAADVCVFPSVRVVLSEADGASGDQADAEEPAPGYRTRMGGKPQWLQSNETPICESCDKAMTFVAQIDSVAHQDTELGRQLATKDSFMFADVGMIYVFWCAGCNGTKSLLQCG
jgi:hypothetical protein